MASSSNSNTRYPIRSISLPCRSHPNAFSAEEELNKLKTWEAPSTPKAEAICNGLSRLKELYKCLDHLYNLPLTQQALSHNQREKWVDGLLDGSVKLLDICGMTRDVMSRIKEHVRDIQCALRRRKLGHLNIESSIAKYISFRKKVMKDANKFIAALKQMNGKVESSELLTEDQHASSVIREVGVVSISVLTTLLLFLSMPVLKPKPSKWSLVSKLLHKGAEPCEDRQEDVNELGRVDVALRMLCRSGLSEGDKMQMAQSSLEALAASLEVIENGSECIFRQLIKVRASLLNIVSY